MVFCKKHAKRFRWPGLKEAAAAAGASEGVTASFVTHAAIEARNRGKGKESKSKAQSKSKSRSKVGLRPAYARRKESGYFGVLVIPARTAGADRLAWDFLPLVHFAGLPFACSLR